MFIPSPHSNSLFPVILSLACKGASPPSPALPCTCDDRRTGDGLMALGKRHFARQCASNGQIHLLSIVSIPLSPFLLPPCWKEEREEEEECRLSLSLSLRSSLLYSSAGCRLPPSELRLYSLLSFCLVLSLPPPLSLARSLRPIFPGRRNLVQAFKAKETEGTLRDLRAVGGKFLQWMSSAAVSRSRIVVLEYCIYANQMWLVILVKSLEDKELNKHEEYIEP